MQYVPNDDEFRPEIVPHGLFQANRMLGLAGALMIASSDQQRIVCEHAGGCGGCPLIGLSYREQLAAKHRYVVDSLRRYPSLELIPTHPVAPAEPVVGYRTRAKLIVAPDAKLGLFATGGGHRVVDIPRCRVLAASLAGVAAILRERIATAQISGGVLAPVGTAARSCLRAVDLREVRDGETVGVLVTFVVERVPGASVEALASVARELMETAPQVQGVACSFHDGRGPQVLGNETVLLAGVQSARDQVGGSLHLATFGSFVQAHRGQAGRVHALLARAFDLPRPARNVVAAPSAADAAGGTTPMAAGAVRRPPRVLDLYAGSGSIALALAAAGASVHLVESFAPAVAQARAAAQAQGIVIEAECADVAVALRALTHQGRRFDAVVVNPPRRGTSPSVREWLARLAPPIIAYVSCDPVTLARDLDHLARLGYASRSLHPIDMIPLTDEVETVAFIGRAAVPAPRVMYEDDEAIIVDKGAHEPTTPQGEYPGSLLARVKRMPGAQDAVPVHRLDIGTSGLVLFARRAGYVAKWQRVLSAESTRKVYLGAARGITPSKGSVARDLREHGSMQAARTRYRRLAIAAGHSVLRILPQEGRTHQIRRHLAAIGHPILGDNRYGHPPTNRFFEEKNGLDRTFLHCTRLEFDHPDTGRRHVVDAPLAGDLHAVLDRVSGDADGPELARKLVE
ncbi:MAG: pseudouridine synthase [Myxococcota bacterium]|nr:pseudouridine synthase [Myxococcota bacterium]